MHASVNPFCRLFGSAFSKQNSQRVTLSYRLTRSPSTSLLPCAGERSWKKRRGSVGLLLIPGPVPGPSAHQGRAWDLCFSAPGLCVAAVTDASIASRWDAPAQPRIPFHTSETAEGGAAGGRQLRTYSKKKKKKEPPLSHSCRASQESATIFSQISERLWSILPPLLFFSPQHLVQSVRLSGKTPDAALFCI